MTTSTRLGLIDDIVISIVLFLVVSLRNTDGTVIQGANSYCDVVDADGEIKAETTLSAAQTKGNKARKVWFAEKIRVELAAYVAAHKPKQLTQPLFYTQRSEGFTANTLTHIVNGIYKHAGISGATSHSGRRTGLTNLAERGVGVRVLMALAGHSNMATTQRYIDIRPAMLKAAVELV